MQYVKVFPLILLAICFRLGSLQAEDRSLELAQAPFNNPQPLSEAGLIQGKISLDLRNIDAVDALKFLAMKAGLNIVVTKNVIGRVSLAVENVLIRDVFDIMLRLNNLAYDLKGEIYNVMTETEYNVLYGRKFSDTRQIKVFRLNYAIPEQAFNLLDAVKSGIGRLLVDAESGTVMIMDTQERIQEAQDILEKLEQKTSLRMFGLKYAKAKDIEEQLKAQLDLKKVGTIKADERTNQVIVQTLPERMKNIEELISGLDQKTKAVLVDTKIIKIKLSDQLDSGIEWEGIFNIGKKYGLNYLGSYPFSAIQKATDVWASREKFFANTMAGSIGAYPFSGTAVDNLVGSKSTLAEKMHIGMIDRKRDFDLLIKYLQTLGRTKIISNPTMTVIDNKEAKIHVGERRAYVTTTVTTGTTTKTVSEEVTYVDVGVQLSITPTINEDGYITMKVKPEISSVVGNVETSEGNMIPIIDTSTAETVIMAKDGSTVIIGGMGREEKAESAKQVPVLGNIPLLGFFFRSKTQKLERTELLILLTPIIYEGDKLITPKDKENELFGVKPFKKFDVFRQEVPLEQANEEFIPSFKSFSADTVVQPPKDQGIPFETRDSGRGIQDAGFGTRFSPSAEPRAPSPETKFTPKGLKSYSIIEIPFEQIPEATKPKAKDAQGEQILPKGFRTYN